MKLAQYLARSGLGSRRSMEQVVKSGRVTVDGDVCTDQSREVDGQEVRLDGRVVTPADLVYFAWHKPVGVTTTFADSHAEKTLSEALPKEIRQYPVFAVGRLDRDTEGLLLLTTDGEWAEKLIHPRAKSEKVYRALIQGEVFESAFDRLKGGVDLEDGHVRPLEVKRAEKDEGGEWLEITLTEGRNRVVRRMVEAVGLKLLRLQRTRIGEYILGDLKPNEFRPITP